MSLIRTLGGIAAAAAPEPPAGVYGDDLSDFSDTVIPMNGEVIGPRRVATGPEGGWNWEVNNVSSSADDRWKLVADEARVVPWGAITGPQCEMVPPLTTPRAAWLEYIQGDGWNSGGHGPCLLYDPAVGDAIQAAQSSWSAAVTVRFVTNHGGTSGATIANTSAISPGSRVRVEVNGDDVFCYYDTGGGWVQFHDGTGLSEVASLTGTRVGMLSQNSSNITTGAWGPLRFGVLPYTEPP